MSVDRRKSSKTFRNDFVSKRKAKSVGQNQTVTSTVFYSSEWSVTFQSLTNCSRKSSKKTAAVKPKPGI